MNAPVLQIESLHKSYGALQATRDVALEVAAGEIHALIGPNGAGKSTAMKAVFGMLGLRAGRVTLGGEDITSLKPQERVLRGMGFVPQNQNVFTSMTVEELSLIHI